MGLSLEKLTLLLDEIDSGQSRLLRTYVSEAEFFLSVLDSDLRSLEPGSNVVEIGSGVGLLSLLVAERGFRVTSYEPMSAGFGQMRLFRSLLIEAWDGDLPDVEWRDTNFGESDESPSAGYCFAYAINVIEHVPGYESLVKLMYESLSPSGILRIICPNYSFPYEPHFETPTVWSKRLTRRIFEQRIAESDIASAFDFWEDLSWPTVVKLRHILAPVSDSFVFLRDATEAYVVRAREDVVFTRRKPRIIRSIAGVAPLLVRAMPVSLLPVIDVRVRKVEAS